MPFTKPIILISGIVAIFFLFFLLIWFLIKNIPFSEKIEKTMVSPPAKNFQERQIQKSTIITATKIEEEALNKMKFLFLEKKNEKVLEKKTIREENKKGVWEGKKEDDENVVDPAAETTTHFMKVLSNNVNIRTKPSLESDVIGRLGQGYIVRKLDSKGDWVYVDSEGGFKGWVYYDLVENTTEDEHEAWRNNPNKSAAIGLIRRGLEDPDKMKTEKKKIEKLLNSWKTAWGKKDIERYMSFYSKAFTKSTFNWEGYKEYKKNIFNRPEAISIEIKNIEISLDNYLMIVSFIQKYQSGIYKSTTQKVLHLQLEKEGWKIVKEVLIKHNV